MAGLAMAGRWAHEKKPLGQRTQMGAEPLTGLRCSHQAASQIASAEDFNKFPASRVHNKEAPDRQDLGGSSHGEVR